MKILGFFGVLALICQLINAAHSNLNEFDVELYQSLQPRSVNDKFKAILEHFKEIMKSENNTIGLPRLDPYEIAHHLLKFEKKIFNGELEILKFRIDGLSNYAVQKADFKIAKWTVAVDFLWSQIKGKTGYSMHGHLLEKLGIYGEGDFDFEINDLHFATELKLKVNFKTKEISLVSVNNTVVSVKDVKFAITGLYEDEEISKLAGDVISDVIPDTIKDFQLEVTSTVNELLKTHGNEILKKFKVDDIIGALH